MPNGEEVLLWRYGVPASSAPIHEEALESPKRETPQVLVEGDEVEAPGPATPTSFREQCYLDRERLEKKPRVSASSKKRGSTGSRDVTGLVGQFSQL